jgi:tripartite ATP-independent transporter DctM subunit
MLLARLDRAALTVTERIAAAGVLSIIAVALVTVFDVALRAAFNSPIRGLNEITQPLMAIGVAACLPAGVMGRVNITIEAAESVLPRIVYAWLRVLGAAALFAFLALVAARLWLVAVKATALDSTSSVLNLPVGLILKVATVFVFLAAAAQLVPVIRTVADVFAINRRVASLVSAVLLVVFLVCVVWWPIVLSALQPLFDMPAAYLAIACFGLILVLVLLTVPIAAAMGLAGLVGSFILMGTGPALSIFGTKIQEMLFNDNLAVLPLFLLMGSFATIAGMSSEIYRCAYSIIGHLRGGLAIATVLGSAGFGALTGSSLATSVTIGKVSLPEMAARNYSRSLAAGTVAAGGPLGQLVPPSTLIVIYALLSEASIGTLFIASIGPALLTVVLYIAAILLLTKFRPDLAPAGPRSSTQEILQSITGAWKAILLIGAVIGGIYTGLFTEVEAASIGVIGAFAVAVFKGAVRRDTIWAVMRETTVTVALVYPLIFGAASFSFLVGISGLPDLFVAIMTSITQQPLLIVLMIVIMYLVLGAVMDSVAIMIITVPVLLPLISQLGIDQTWWAILTICLVETGLITPPFGLNLFVMKSIDPELTLTDIYKGVTPFILADLLKVILLIAFPAIIIWLPGTR